MCDNDEIETWPKIFFVYNENGKRKLPGKRKISMDGIVVVVVGFLIS